MKYMIELFRAMRIILVLVLLAGIGLPLFAQAPPSNEAIRVIQAQPNAVSNLLHRNLGAGEKHYYRMNNLTDAYYYIFWRDSDSSANLTAPFADIKVSIVNLSTNMVIISNVDVDRSFNEEREINSIEITRGVHYIPGNDILIIVEGFNFNDSGNYAILVY